MDALLYSEFIRTSQAFKTNNVEKPAVKTELIGTVIDSPNLSDPTYLPLDGRTLYKDDYPELCALLDLYYARTTDTTFTLPNVSGTYKPRIKVTDTQVRPGSSSANTWRTVGSSLAYTGLAVSSNGKIIYAVNNQSSTGKYFYSFDAGYTVTQSALVSGTGFVGVFCSTDGSCVLLDESMGGSGWCSSLAGDLWNTADFPGGSTIANVAYARNDSNLSTIGYTYAGALYLERMYSYGTSLSELKKLTSTVCSGVVVSDDFVYQYASLSTAASKVYASTNSGTTWLALSNSPSASWLSIACSGSGRYVYAVAATTYIYKSADYGVTWTACTTSLGTKSWKLVRCSQDGRVLLAALTTSSSLYTSIDYGVTWRLSSSPVKTWNNVFLSDDGTKICGIAAGTDFIYVDY